MRWVCCSKEIHSGGFQFMTFSRVCFASPQGGVWSDRHCEERSDEAIQSGISVASRHDVALAMTSRSRDASQRPRHATPLSEVVTTDLHSVLRAKRQQANAGGSIGKRRFARMTKEKNERKKNIGGETPTDARLFCRGIGHGRAPARRGAHLSAFHRGSHPKESFIARDSASGQASWDVAGYVLRIL
jgi:hypothetical protein